MEISGKIQPLDSTDYAKKNAPQAEKPAPAVSGADRVELSSRAREMQAAHTAIKQMDDVDHDKVARIKKQIQSGTYTVDAQKIAGKMLEETLLGDVD